MMEVSKKDLKVIFIVPADHCEYLGVGLLSSCLKRSGVTNISVVQARLSRIEAAIAGASHCVLAFSPFSFCANDFVELAGVIKKKYAQCVNVFGGSHATFAPEIVYSDGVDAVCRGEAEEAFPELIDELVKNWGALPCRIRNWWVKDASGHVHKNSIRPVVRDLDSLPWSDKCLFTKTLFFRRGFRRFIFSRGCMFRCNYCSVPSWRGLYDEVPSEYLRVRSVESTIAEIRSVLDTYGGTTVGIIDSIFGADLEWLQKFACQYKKQIGLPFYCHTEVNLVSPRYVALLKEAGCYFLWMGLECANESVRKAVLNKHFTNEQFESGVQMIRAQGIKLGLYNMIGIPGSDFEDDLQTLVFNQRVQPHLPEFHVFSLYPGTALDDQWKGRAGDRYVEDSPYWSAITSSTMRPDIARVVRLHYLFGIMVRWRIPLVLVRLITRLPLDFAYRFLGRLAARAHYHHYDPE